MHNVNLLIGGQEIEASSGQTFDRVNPITGEVASRAAAATKEDAEAAANAAAQAFPEWSNTAPAQRRIC